jgi:hypothetical protein
MKPSAMMGTVRGVIGNVITPFRRRNQENMKYLFIFNEINFGRIEIEADHKPDNGEIIEKILEGNAYYHNTDFTDFRLVEMDGVAQVNTRNRKFKVTITETLKLGVEVEAGNEQEAEQIVSDNWRNSQYVLGAENFTNVEFNAILLENQEK